MTVFKREGIYHYEFEFMGQRVRESAHTRNRELALSIERKRRTKLEESAGGVKRPKPLPFRKAAKTWLAGNAHWTNSTREINTLKLSHLLPVFGKMILSDIDNDAISKFQRKRQKSGASGREINMETAVLRMILRQHDLWHLLASKFHPMPEREDVGRALTVDEVDRILLAAIESRSRSLFPALMVYLHTGVRAAEGRLRWKQVDFENRTITVGHSKTKGGEGRVIPLNDEAFEILLEWRTRFDDPKPNHYVFPSERYGFNGHRSHLTGAVAVFDLDPSKPMGSWKTAWTACKSRRGVVPLARFAAHVHLRTGRGWRPGNDNEGDRRVDVRQDAGAVFPHAQPGQARRSEQTAEAQTPLVLPPSSEGPHKIPHTPKRRRGCLVGNPFFIYGRQGGV